MQYFPPALENLVEQFAKLPGVGVKSAQRLAFYVLSMPDDEANAFAQAVISAKTSIHCCPVCQNLTDGDGPCSICASPKRDQSTICVVADPKDVIAMERSREYPGTYHVLHGVISPMNHVGPDDLHIKELTARVGWAKSTTMTMLTRMEKKGLIGYEDGGRAKLYYPKVEREAAAAAETVSFLDRVYRGSISAMMSAMTAREALSQAEIEELYAILRQAEGKEERP